MGVHKLWDLLTATALPVRVESLFGKVCCVDASFWISHCLASESNMRHGGDVIAVFFLRICYLLDKGIKPVFVFDGKSPFAKLKTILKRKFINQKLVTNHKLLAFKMLATQLKNSNKYKMPSTILNDKIVTDDKVDDDERGYYDYTDEMAGDGDNDYYNNQNNDSNSFNDKIKYHLNLDNFSSNDSTSNYLSSNNNSTCIDYTKFYQPSDNIHYDKNLNTKEEVNLLDLFPEEFLNKSDEEFEEEFQILKDCDYLSPKSKYDIINTVRDNIIQKDREKFTSLKGKIDEYSDRQIKSYMRDVKINNEIDQLKRELNESYLHLYQPIIQNYNINNNLNEEIYDYNEYFDKKYAFNRKEDRYEYDYDNNIQQYKYDDDKNIKYNIKTNDYDMCNSNKRYTSNSTSYYNNEQNNKVKYSDVIYEKKEPKSYDNNFNYNQNKNVDIDESIYASDETLFGEEMLSGINDHQTKRDGIDNIAEYKNYNKDDVDIIEITENKDYSNKDINNIIVEDKSINKSDNNFFLEMYRKYFNNRDIKSLNDDKTVDNTDTNTDNTDNKDDISMENYADYKDFEESENIEKNENDHQNDDDLNTYDNDYIQRGRHISEHTESDGVVIGQKHQYYEDVQALLDRFGVPYIIAPSEAESQCAYMNMIGDCYAVISDDSDSLVFGAKLLLKNFYNDNVFELYKSDRIEKELGIGREQLALIAIICGCDYTNGVKGIGIVNSLEVIKAYPKFDDLYEFKKWATSDCSIESATYDECPIRREYKIKHINYRIHWTFSSDFPNKEAYDLFINPKVTNEYKLKWDKPNKELLIEYMKKKSGIELKQVIECLKVLFNKKSQQFIMEDMISEIESKPIEKMAIKNYRINMNANLSAFRKVLNNIKNKNKFNLRSNRIHDKSHTLSKIRSKRIVDSIKIIKRRYSKNINNDL